VAWVGDLGLKGVMGTEDRLLKAYRRLLPSNGVVLGDVREYVPGDDVRFIDWNVTARLGNMFVDGVEEDGGNDIVFVVDGSASMEFGSHGRSKISLAMKILGKICRLAKRNHDRGGLVIFSDGIEKYFPPRMDTAMFGHAIAGFLRSGGKRRTDLAATLKVLGKILKKRSVIFLICDIFALGHNRKGILSQLHVLGSRHGVILLAMVDRNDMPCAGIGPITVEDAETGITYTVDTDDRALMDEVAAKYEAYKRLILDGMEGICTRVCTVDGRNSAESFLNTFFQ
jgi:uncharacterized protein (DUF58 family)